MTLTHCPYCALQCAMHVEPDGAGGHASRPAPFPASRGGLCRKGWTAGSLLNAPDRLTTPLLRTSRDAALRPVSWDTALDFVAGRLAALRAEHGPDAVAVFGGGGLTNEKSYLLGKFARVALGTSQIDYNGRFCMSSAAAAGTRAFGTDRGLPFPVTDLADSDVVLLAGANVAETMPPLMGHLSGPRLIVVDPRRTATARRATANGGLHLAPRPGTDLALAMGLLHAARTEGLLDDAYVAERTTGFASAWRHCAQWWPERAERTTGVPAADIRAAARLLGTAARAHVLTGRGSEQHADGTATVSAWINLALGLGLPGRHGSGYGCLTGQGNGQGGREHGQKADQLPGYRRIDDPKARADVAAVWGVDPDSLPGPGRSAFELLDALGTEGGPRALLLFGSNPVVSAPDSGRVRNRIAATELLVVADFFVSETARSADVVLPVAQWAEEDGTMTNLEGRVLVRRAAVAPPEGVRGDLDVLHGLAVRLGRDGAEFPPEAARVFAELRAASAGGPADYSGVAPERLERGEALYWPCPPGGAGTPRLFLDAFAHPDGRARFAPVEYRGDDGPPDEDYPLVATTGRVLAHYQSGAQTRRVPELLAAEPECFVEVHPDTAARNGLADGHWARVLSPRGSTEARVHCTTGIRRDTVFLPFHYGDAQSANLITDPALDPTSRMPEFKAFAARIEPRDPSPPGERP